MEAQAEAHVINGDSSRDAFFIGKCLLSTSPLSGNDTYFDGHF